MVTPETLPNPFGADFHPLTVIELNYRPLMLAGPGDPMIE